MVAVAVFSFFGFRFTVQVSCLVRVQSGSSFEVFRVEVKG